MNRVSVILVLLAAPAFAQTAPAPAAPAEAPTANAPASPSSTSAPSASEQEIERALQADQAAKAKNQPPAATATPMASQQSTPLGRFFQSMNPDISAIIDFAAGWYSKDDQTVKSGDDPGKAGFNAQEVELAFQATVDPYFRADVYLTIPNAQGLEIEEAFLTTTSLPGNLQLRAGIFRADIGRQNTQHLHMQDFTRRPWINPYFLGIDGLRAPGLEVSWLVPRLPFFLMLSASAFSVPAAEANQQLQTFGGGQPWDFTYLGTMKAFFDLTESTSLYVGASYARGKTSQTSNIPNFQLPQVVVSTTPLPTAYDNWYDNLYGFYEYLKWKPPNQAKTYTSVAWTSEYYLRQIPDVKLDGTPRPQLEGGLYSQLVFQVQRRWYLGLRGQLNGIPSGDNVKFEYGGSASVTWGLSEFSRVRLYGELEYQPHFLKLYGAAFVQLEAAIGAHGAHPF